MNEGANILKGRNNNQLVLDKSGGITVSTGTSFILVNSLNIPQPPVTTPSSETSTFIIVNPSTTGSITGSKDIIPLYYPTENVPEPVNTLITDTSSLLLPEEEFLFQIGNPEEEIINDPTVITPITPEVYPNAGSLPGGTTTDADYKDRAGPPRQIILHITDARSAASSIIAWVNRKVPAGSPSPNKPNVFGNYSDGTPIWGGIHWAIGEDGDILKGISENKYTVHGDGWNTYGIGIEISGAFRY